MERSGSSVRRALRGSRVRFHRSIWAAVVAICLCLMGFTGWMVRQHHGRAMEEARSRTESAVQMLEQRLIGTLDSIDRLLSLAANQLGPNLREGMMRIRAGLLLTQVQ